MSDDIMKLIKDEDIKFVDLRFTDPRGKMQHVTFDIGMVDADFFTDGQMFDGSSISGWKAINESDMTLMPDTSTAIVDPFFQLVGRDFEYDSNGDIQLVSAGSWGDLNLDGQVSGDGTGSWDTDDVSAFREGWGWNINDEPGAEIEGIFAWKRGDLNQDGATDWEDYLLLRNGYLLENNVQLSLAAVLGGAVSVPEPSSAVLVGLLLSAGIAGRFFCR